MEKDKEDKAHFVCWSARRKNKRVKLNDYSPAVGKEAPSMYVVVCSCLWLLKYQARVR